MIIDEDYHRTIGVCDETTSSFQPFRLMLLNPLSALRVSQTLIPTQILTLMTRMNALFPHVSAGSPNSHRQIQNTTNSKRTRLVSTVPLRNTYGHTPNLRSVPSVVRRRDWCVSIRPHRHLMDSSRMEPARGGPNALNAQSLCLKAQMRLKNWLKPWESPMLHHLEPAVKSVRKQQVRETLSFSTTATKPTYSEVISVIHAIVVLVF